MLDFARWITNGVEEFEPRLQSDAGRALGTRQINRYYYLAEFVGNQSGAGRALGTRQYTDDFRRTLSTCPIRLCLRRAVNQTQAKA